MLDSKKINPKNHDFIEVEEQDFKPLPHTTLDDDIKYFINFFEENWLLTLIIILMVLIVCILPK